MNSERIQERYGLILEQYLKRLNDFQREQISNSDYCINRLIKIAGYMHTTKKKERISKLHNELEKLNSDIKLKTNS